MRKVLEFFRGTFLYCLAIELVEEGLEELIAWEISNLISKALSALVVVGITQTVKLLIKKIVKRITYKEGNDKVEKLKKFFSWIWSNKCTLGGIATGAITVISGLGVIDVSTFPELLIGTFNVTPVIYYGLLGILTIICSFFPETVEKFKARIAEAKQAKEDAQIEKQAVKELKQEEKTANQTQAQAEATAKKEQAKAEAEAKAKAEAEAYRAKVEAKKAELQANQTK